MAVTVGVGVTAVVGVTVGVGVTAVVGVTVAMDFAVADAEATLDEECAVADAVGDDDEDDPVHPAVATQIRSAAHIAIIAACFFIKVIPRKIRSL